MRNLKPVAAALVLLIANAPAAAIAGGDRLAPAVVRKPATPLGTASGRAPGAPAPSASAQSAPAGADAIYSALAASAGGADSPLDKGLITAMSRLIAAGRCGDATALATGNRRVELAGRARQLCGAR